MYVTGEGIDVVLLEALKAKYNYMHYLDEFQELRGRQQVVR